LVSFIKTGTPGVPWERYGRETPYYFNLNVNGSSKFLGPRLKMCDFWNELFPLIKKPRPAEIRSFSGDLLIDAAK